MQQQVHVKYMMLIRKSSGDLMIAARNISSKNEETAKKFSAHFLHISGKSRSQVLCAIKPLRGHTWMQKQL